MNTFSLKYCARRIYLAKGPREVFLYGGGLKDVRLGGKMQTKLQRSYTSLGMFDGNSIENLIRKLRQAKRSVL